MKATWENMVLAESDKTIVIEGNHYFPPDSVKKEYFRASDKHSTCPWKGSWRDGSHPEVREVVEAAPRRAHRHLAVAIHIREREIVRRILTQVAVPV